MNKSKNIALRFLACPPRRGQSNKRGSHVGMVLSFVIFITFLIFLYSILEPAAKTQKDKQALLDYLKIELTKRFSADITSVAISTREIVKEECVKLVNLTEEVEIDSHLIVKDEEGDISLAIISESDNKDLYIEKEAIEVVFFKIYNSEEFEELGVGTMEKCNNLRRKEKEYIVGLVRTDEYIFETKIIDLIDEYETSYENLKNELNIPIGSEFGFSFTYTNKTVIGTGEKNVSTSIYAEEIPIQYIDREASVNSGFINIQVW